MQNKNVEMKTKDFKYARRKKDLLFSPEQRVRVITFLKLIPLFHVVV